MIQPMATTFRNYG